MITKALALLLILLIGNPVCCCAFTASALPTEAASGCCPASASSSEQEDREDEQSCPCFISKVAKQTAEQPALLPGKIVAPVVGPSASTALLLPAAPTTVRTIAKWPPGSLPVPAMTRRLAWRGSFLL